MLIRLRPIVMICALAACAPAVAYAQDFGVMESAETINKGNFKIRGNPMFVFGKDQDAKTGIALTGGYGFTDRFDMEGQVAFYDGVTYFGANAEFWLAKNVSNGLDFSVAAGLHRRTGDNTFDAVGIDLTFLASKPVGPRLELYGGLDLAFEKIKDSDRFKVIHLVPGFEYKVHEDLDLVGELGLALNDDARHYFAIGLAYYFR
jgi:hypothetical protein